MSFQYLFYNASEKKDFSCLTLDEIQELNKEGPIVETGTHQEVESIFWAKSHNSNSSNL